MSNGDRARRGAVWAHPQCECQGCRPDAYSTVYCIGEVRRHGQSRRERARHTVTCVPGVHAESPLWTRNATTDAGDRRCHRCGGAWGCGVVRGTSAQRGDADAPLWANEGLRVLAWALTASKLASVGSWKGGEQWVST